MSKPHVTFPGSVSAQQAVWFHAAADAAYEAGKAAAKSGDTSPITVAPLTVEATLPAPLMEQMQEAVKTFAKAGFADGLAELGPPAGEVITG